MRGAVDSVCTDIECVCGGCDDPSAGVFRSELELLSSPALSTLVGLLALCAGLPGAAEPGLLSPTKLCIKLSRSLRSVALPGIGETS